MYTASVCVDNKEAGERVLGDVELGEGREMVVVREN